jgi:peptidoglycan DL-endopeptidase CwlO
VVGKPSRWRAGRPTLCLLAVGAVIVAGLLPAAPAQAEPTPDEIEAMIDKQWERLEPTIEQYNKVRSQLVANRKKSADLQKRIGPLSEQAERALDQVGQLATTYYKSGPAPAFSALLSGGSPSSLPERLALLDRIAADEHKQVAALTETRDRYSAEKRKLDGLIALQHRQEAELAAKKKHIDAEIKRLERVLAEAERAAAAAPSTSEPRTTVEVSGCPRVSAVGAAAIAVQTACAQIGDPYVWGAAGPDAFDCSGLTQYAWGKAGVYLTHHTGDQWNETTRVSSSEARAGDLVFFYSDLHHVGLYLGNGLIVHASRAGQPVKVSEVSYMPLAGYRRVG